MSKQQEAEAAPGITLLPGTFTTGYRRDLELARKLVRARQNGVEVRAQVIPRAAS